MLFARTVDVEVTQADHGAFHLGKKAANVVVEDELGIAVDVQWTLVDGRFREDGTGSVDRCGGGIDERDLAVEREVQQFLRVGEVVVHHVATIVLERVRTSALMQDGADFCTLEVARLEGGAEFTLVHVVGVSGAGQIQELWPGQVGGGSEVIHQENVAFASAVELMDDIAADKARAAGNDDHFFISSV
jgi:hypothetical protein